MKLEMKVLFENPGAAVELLKPSSVHCGWGYKKRKQFCDLVDGGVSEPDAIKAVEYNRGVVS